MAIAYIYYTNKMNKVTVYLWEPKQETNRYYLRAVNENVYACKEVAINFVKQKCYIKKDGCMFEAPLREPKREKRNLKHQAHFDFDEIGDWAEAF